MRVIAGKARSIRLETPEGNDTRPTTDRLKETLFNIIQPHLADAVFLDLFSGSGAIGIEAISRGAKKSYFFESEKAAFSCIERNIKATKFEEQAILYKQDVLFGVSNSVKEKVDIIFMDPPYDMGHEKKVLELLANSTIIDDETLIIIESSLDTDFSYVDDLGFEITKEKRYKTNMHVFLYKKSE